MGSHERGVDHQRIDNQDKGCVVESPHDAAYESLCEIHSYGSEEGSSHVESLVFESGPVDRMGSKMRSRCLKG